MQGQPACRAGEPSGQGEEPPPEGLGGGYPLSQTDPRRPAGQVVGHRLDGQPGAVGGEAARGEMVQPDAVLEVAYGILDLGVAAMVSTGAPSCRLRTLTRRPPSVDSGLGRRCNRVLPGNADGVSPDGLELEEARQSRKTGRGRTCPLVLSFSVTQYYLGFGPR